MIPWPSPIWFFIYKSIFNRDINNVRIAKQSVSIQSLFVDLDTNDSKRIYENYRSFISVEYDTFYFIRLQARFHQIDGFN